MTSFRYLLAATTGIALLATAGSALAAPFTFNPSLSAPALSNAGAFTADDIIFSQYSSISVANNGTFTETGILRIANFQNNGAAVFPAGFGGIPGANPYSLYLTFTGAGTATSATAGSTGTFTSLTVNFFGDAGNDDGSIAVTQAGATFAGNTGNDVLLATGTLTSGTVGLTANTAGATPDQPNPSPVLPSAFALVRFTDATGSGGFFVDPSTLQFNLDSSFTNSNSVTTFAQTATGINLTVRGGGGNGTILTQAAAVPEPASMALLGMGLAAVGLVRRRRA